MSRIHLFNSAGVALVAAMISLVALLALSSPAAAESPSPVEISVDINPSEPEPTILTVEGAASRSVSYDGTVGQFTISVLRPTVLEAVSAGNVAANAIADSVAEHCTKEEPEDTEDTAEPSCVSPNGLQTTRIRIHEEFDWTEQGRVSQGFRYENGLSIAIRGTEFAGRLVDLVIRAGGDLVRFDGLDFTTSQRAEVERLALLDAIDDAQATAAAIAAHMGYEIVRVVELSPLGSLTAARVYEEEAEELAADAGFEPTPVFGGMESITSRVRMVFELRPAAADEE
jgi:uncharacterized protein YggE